VTVVSLNPNWLDSPSYFEMVSILSAMMGLAGLLLVPHAMADCPNQLQPANGAPIMAKGYEAKLLVGGLKTPRGIIFDSDGNLLVTETATASIRRIELEDKGGMDVCVVNSTQIVVNPGINHGIAFSNDGKTLFTSNSTDVFSYSYNITTGITGDRKHLLTGMKQAGYHQSRTLLVPKAAPNLLLVSRGSDGNRDMETREEKSGRSQIRYWEIDEFTGKPLDYSSTGTILGWGLRNSVGVGEDPTTGGIVSIEPPTKRRTKN
jgi:glucose/arabinose dehydrogenase